MDLLQNPFLLLLTPQGFIGLIVLLVIIGIIYLIMGRSEKFTNFPHRSYLASSYWKSKPQIQHSLPDLKLQYPSHRDYFKNGINEKEPINAELARYHKHRYDPAQL